jgi:type IV secretory pathway TrbD component
VKKNPAILDCVAETSGVQIAGLSLLDRLIVTADRAGCAPIYLIFIGIGFGLARSSPASPALVLGISAALGVIISFAVIVCFMQRKSGRKSSGLKNLIDATTNRDFSLLVLLLAIAGKLDLFLWIAGIGVHLFWIIALCSQWQDAEDEPAISKKSA